MKRPVCECHGEPMVPLGKYWWCRIKNREQTARWTRSNPEKIREMERRRRAGPERKVYMREYRARWEKRRRAERIAFAREYLGGKCARCGSTRNLDCDHIDPTTKKFGLTDRPGVSWDVWFAELQKCQLLCRVCHTKKTKNEDASKVQ
jgi:5-methylcytosine-specific restriction endonuclease McrA